MKQYLKFISRSNNLIGSFLPNNLNRSFVLKNLIGSFDFNNLIGSFLKGNLIGLFYLNDRRGLFLSNNLIGCGCRADVNIRKMALPDIVTKVNKYAAVICIPWVKFS